MSLNILNKSVAFLDALGVYVHFQSVVDLIKETFKTKSKTITALKY